MNKKSRKRDNKLIGLAIRKVRKDMGLNQEQFAKKMKLSRVSIVNIEYGRQQPPIHFFLDLVKLSGVTIQKIFKTVI